MCIWGRHYCPRQVTVLYRANIIIVTVPVWQLDWAGGLGRGGSADQLY